MGWRPGGGGGTRGEGGGGGGKGLTPDRRGA